MKMKSVLHLFLSMSVLSMTLGDEFQAVREYSSGYNHFTADIYKEMLKTHSGNFLVCPLSVDIIMALVTSGAKNATHKELTAALRLPEDTSKVNEIFSSLHTNLRSTELYSLNSANKVYLKNSYRVREDFGKVAVESFKAEIQNIDFANSLKAASEINQWVEEKTKNKIKNLVRPDDIGQGTSSVLVNALFFQGSWSNEFYKQFTKPQSFNINSNKQVLIPMMERTKFFGYHESSELNARFLKMDYLGGDASMHIVLPNDVEGLANVETKISDALVEPKYEFKHVEVRLPKFKIETEIQFKPILQKMGVEAAFTSDANFEGILEKNVPLFISAVIQKAFIDVDEKGTTAAAATAVTMFGSAAVVTPSQVIKFHVDRPFLFYLRLNKPGINFFVGRYTGL